MGVFTEPVIEIEIEIRSQSRFTKNVIEIEFQFQADHDWNFIWNFNLTKPSKDWNKINVNVPLYAFRLFQMYYSFYKMDAYLSILNVKHELAKISFFHYSFITKKII